MNTLTSLAPRIPTVIKINGNKLTGMPPDSAILPVADHEGVSYIVAPHPAVVLVAWVTTSVTHLLLFNKLPWGTPPLKVTTDVGGGPYLLEPHCALGWTSSDWLRSLSMFGGDPNLEARVQANATDPNDPSHTGSAGIEFFHPVTCKALEWKKNGMRPPYNDLLFLDAYWRKQCRRPRHAVNAIGAFEDDSAAAFGPYWDATADKGKGWFTKGSGINLEDGVNRYGLLAWDAQHLDGTELADLYHLTGHPVYLWSLAVLFRCVRKYAWYLQERDDRRDYGGAARTPGWWLTLCGRLQRALAGKEGEVWTTLRAEVDAAIDWHVDNAQRWLNGNWPMKGIMGSVGDPAFRDANGKLVPHQKTWQVAAWAWGLQWAGAPALADRMLDWIEAEAWDGERRLVAENIGYHPDGTIVKAWANLTGTSLWHCAPMIVAGRKDRPMAAALIEAAKETPYAVNYAAPALGKEAVTP